MRHLIVLCLAATTTLSTACDLTMEPVDEEIEAAIAEIGISTRYVIDGSNRSHSQFGYTAPIVWDCDQYEDGVVRSWFLKERNKFDFRYSRHYCRNMGPDGTQETGYDRQDHFYHEGNGDKGNSQTPLTHLPVGVRLRYKYDALGDYAYKISDVAMLYDHADDIIRHFTGYSAAGYAFGHSGDTRTVVCPAGKVMTGLGIKEDTTSGGNNQSEIRGVKIPLRRADHSADHGVLIHQMIVDQSQNIFHETTDRSQNTMLLILRLQTASMMAE